MGGGIELSLVLSDEVLECVGFASEVVILTVELSLEGVAVTRSLGDEGFSLLKLLLGSGELGVTEEHLALELGMLGVELSDAVIEVSLGLVFVGNELVEGVNQFTSEVVESTDDLSHCILVGEVSFSGELKEGLHEWAEGGVAIESLLKHHEVGLDLLHLHEGWVGELGEEAKGLINSSDGVVGFVHLLFKGGVLVSSLEGLEIEVLAVIVDVGVELSEVVGDAIDLRNEDVIDHVTSVEDVSASSVDLLLKSDDFAVVVVGTAVEVSGQLGQLVVQIGNEVIDGLKELLEGSPGVEVDFGIADQP